MYEAISVYKLCFIQNGSERTVRISEHRSYDHVYYDLRANRVNMDKHSVQP